MLRQLIDKSELKIVLSPMALSLLREWEYERMEAHAEEVQWEADNVRQLDVRLEDKLTKKRWLCDVSIRIWETSEIVTSFWLEDQFQNSLQKDEVAWEGRMGNF